RFFFFQAEDGIRVLIVTGVQTCALPIFRFGQRTSGLPKPIWNLLQSSSLRTDSLAWFYQPPVSRTRILCAHTPDGRNRSGRAYRSEERRVGKEWRCGWEQDTDTERRRWC